ncbi:MAG: hypothetical protein QXO03_01315 [Thermoplasmatales archaeon]
MSDNVLIIGIGGAGVNIAKSINFPRCILLDSSTVPSPEKALDKIDSRNQEDVIIISSPAGNFSSSVLPSVCNYLNGRGNKVSLIAIMPFNEESEERKIRAENTLRSLRGMVASCDIVENENFASAMLEKPWNEAMDKINSYVQTLIFKLNPAAIQVTADYRDDHQPVLSFQSPVSS